MPYLEPISPEVDPSIDRLGLQNDALEHLRASAVLMHQLGRLSTSEVPSIMSEIEKRRIESQEETAGLKVDHERYLEIKSALQDMVERLPHAEVSINRVDTEQWVLKQGWVKDLDHPDIKSPLLSFRRNETEPGMLSVAEYEFRSDSLEELRLAETQVWWVSPAKMTLTIDGIKGLGYKQVKAEVPIEDVPPYYVIGEKLDLSQVEEGRDAVRELLMLRAANQSENTKLVIVRVSNTMYDLSNHMSIERLGQVVNNRDLAKYRGEGSYKLSRDSDSIKHVYHKTGLISSRPEPIVLHPEPQKESKKRKFWIKRQDELRRVGLQAQVFSLEELYGTHKLMNPDIFKEFDVPYYAAKLAIILGNESAYVETVGRLLGNQSQPVS